MLSVADIPIAGFHFTGIICAVLWQGREYRLATYLGAKVAKLKNGTARIAQGGLELEARLLKRNERALKAPTKGDMVRTIHESAACGAYFQFCQDGRVVFEVETEQGSFEYEYLV